MISLVALVSETKEEKYEKLARWYRDITGCVKQVWWEEWDLASYQELAYLFLSAT